MARTMVRVSCPSCQVVAINGVVCHELGCSESWRNPRTGRGYDRKCRFCGCKFEPESRDQRFCGEDCRAAFFGE